MGLTYDGITYRSLEEQVRYDAEQIQLLKQADVTINQNLQTVNENLQTEINGKLTKPTNPSAESAVTMLANGTVGTKPLSEIGGKLYRHKIRLNWSDSGYNYEIYFTIFSSIGVSLTINDLYENLKYHDYVFVCETNDIPEEIYYIGDIHMNSNNAIRIDSISVYNSAKIISKEFIIDTNNVTIADTYVEL